MATTEADWLLRLPGAIGHYPWHREDQSVVVTLFAGQLQIRWRHLPVRIIASLRMPRLAVEFAFEGVDRDARLKFMRHFDLTMQRGGG